MGAQKQDYTVGDAVLQLVFLPITLAWAIVKGVFIGLLAVIGISMVS